MKKVFLLVCTLCLLAVGPAAHAAGTAYDWNGMDFSGYQDSGMSTQMLFAQLQMQLAQQSKAEAEERMAAIQAQQEEQEEVVNYINQARELRSQQKNGETVALPAAIKAYLDENGLYYGDSQKPDYDLVLNALEQQQERLSTDVQMQMVFIQDYMDQYNSYLAGANSQFATGSQNASGLMQGSLFSTQGGSGAPMVLSALGGVLVGMGLMWAAGHAGKRREKAGQA